MKGSLNSVGGVCVCSGLRTY